MTERQKQILSAIIEQYAEVAVPVGSSLLAKVFDVSSATIRAEMAELERLGTVGYLVAPASLHRWRLSAWEAAFPNAQTWAPPEILTDVPPPAWAADLDQAVFRGNAFVEETEFFHAASRTLIFNDFLQNHALTGKRVGMPFDIRLSMTKKELARRSLRKLLSWDFDNLILAHGECVSGGAKALVESALRFLA